MFGEDADLPYLSGLRRQFHVSLSDHVDGYNVGMERTFLDWLPACVAVIYGAFITYQMLCQILFLHSLLNPHNSPMTYTRLLSLFFNGRY